MIILVSLFVVLMGLFYCWFELRTSRMRRLTSNMPGPKGYPFFGSVFEFSSKPDEILQALLRIASLGPVVALWVGARLNVVLSGPEEIQAILSSNAILEKSYTYDCLKYWLGSGLLTSGGDEWKKHRKLITPAFHFKILEQFADMFSPNLDTFINKIEKEVGKRGFDITGPVALLTLDIVSETSMGIKINAQVQEESSFVQAIHDIALMVVFRVIKPWLESDFLFYLSPDGRLFKRQCGVIQKVVEEVIRKKRQQKIKMKVENSNEDSEVLGQKKRSAFLDLLIDYNLTDEEIKNEVNTLMFAGHDTTTSALCFIFYCLMKYPEVQEKVYKEQLEILGNSDKYATFQDLKNMKYLECVINETERLYPSVPYVGRMATEDFKLSSEYTLPKGCAIVLMICKLHRDPKLFQNPDTFDPDRFLPENSLGRHPYAFCPFSAGPRNCIGQKFAMLELKAVVSAVIRKFKILPPIDCPDIVVGSELILRSVTGFYIRLEKR